MMGDSKSNANANTWPYDMAGRFADVLGISGATVASTATSINTILASSTANTTGDVGYVLIDLGANDSFTFPEDPAQRTTWVNNYLTIVDAAHVKFPGATEYVTKPWRQSWAPGVADMVATWVDDVDAARTYVHLGDDEREWFASCVATCSLDGIHYNGAAGQASAVTAKRAAIGY